MREGRSMAGTWKLHHDAPVYTSLIPGFSPPGALEHFQYANAKQKKTSEILSCVVMLGSIRQEGGIHAGREGPCQRSQDHSAGYQTKSCIDTAL